MHPIPILATFSNISGRPQDRVSLVMFLFMFSQHVSLTFQVS